MKTRRATVSFKTVGCRLNKAETAAIRASFEEAGFATVRFGEACDVCVIHGCVVTSKAEEDGLRLTRSIKRRYPDVFVILAGCAAELLAQNNVTASFCHSREGGNPGKNFLDSRLHGNDKPFSTRGKQCNMEIPIREHSDIDYIAGQKEKFNLPEILGTRFQVYDKQPTNLSPKFDTQRAIVKIQDGCDFHCAYCIVPRVRGASKSRPAAEIIDEISRLTLCGFPEIVLTGANIGCYADGNCNLPQLLEKVEVISGLQRFRISSLEIATVEREVIDFMTSSQKMCRFLHLPMQSGSDSVLKAMGRPYTAEKYRSTIEYAQKKLGLFGLGTDIIVGFPGENTNDFEATVEIVRQLPFNKLHVFSYSSRPGTPASLMPTQVSPKDKEMRSTRLIELGRQKRKEFAQSLVGKQVSILVEKTTPEGLVEGWTGEYIWARVKIESLRRKQIAQFIPENAKDDILLGAKYL